MRIVNFESQERVDLPDMTAVSFLVLGEFRKTIRDLLLGFDTGGSDKFVVRGFEVEPSAAPDSRVRVRMDIGDADRIGTALLSENLGANTEYGQLVGGEDSAAALEGQAQQILDFTALGAATYVVEMRFSYGSGANDNRAKWNPGVDSEFIASQDTRNEPVWTARIVASATGGEWLPLASVVWDTVGPITTSEITDARVFAFEGAAGAFDSAAQAGPGGMDDFPRSSLRGNLSIGRNEVYRALRALGRQVQDLKGQDEAGVFNWYGRVYGPTDANDALADEQTRSLRCLDTVMFTVGDGVSTYGDFNGATGLEDCLQHIEDMGANTPNSIEIVCKSRAVATPAPFTWPVTTSHTINAACDRLMIDFQGNAITATHPVSTSALDVSGELEIRNLVMTAAPTNNATVFEATRLLLINAIVQGDVSATSAAAVDGGPGSYLENSQVVGITRFTNPLGAPSADTLFNEPVRVRGCKLSAIEVTGRTVGEKSLPLHMSDSTVTMSRTDGFGLSAAVLLRENENCKIRGCTIIYVPDVDGVSVTVSAGAAATELVVDGCTFKHSATVAAGTGGFAISLGASPRANITNCTFDMTTNDGGGIFVSNTFDVFISKCNFRGNDVSGRASTDPAISLNSNIDRVTIEGCVFDGWEPNTGSGSERCILPTASAAIEQLTVNACTFRSNGGYAFRVDIAASCNLCVLSNNTLLVPEAAGLGFRVDAWTRGMVIGNTMEFTTASSAAIFGGATGDAVCSGNRVHNGVISSSGATLYGLATTPPLNYET